MSTIARKVVTGATGFLGRALVADLASAGEPFVALRRGNGGHVTRDALPIRRGDHVFHLAALTGVPLSWDYPRPICVSTRWGRCVCSTPAAAPARQ